MLPLAALFCPLAPYNDPTSWLSKTRYNNHILYLGDRGNPITQRMLSAVCWELPYDHSLWHFIWDFPEHPHWVWNAGLLHLCDQFDCGVARLPWPLVDPDLSCGGMGSPCEGLGCASKCPPSSLRHAFVWHVRNLHGHACERADEGVRRTDAWLAWLLIKDYVNRSDVALHGKDLFDKKQCFTPVHEWLQHG